MLVRRNDVAHAREMFAQAIRLAPGKIDAYAYWLGTLAGRPVTDMYIRLLHWLRLKRSGNSGFARYDRENTYNARVIK